MPNHKSALKRVRNSKTKRLRNKYQHTTCRTFMKKLRKSTDSQVAIDQLNKVSSMLDKLAKKNIIHKNKSANLKSKLTKHINKLQPTLK